MIIFLYNNGIRKYRLFSKISYSHTRPNHIVISTKPNAYNLQKLSKFKLHNKEKDETVKNKIVYNSVIKTNNTFYGNRKQQIEEDENLTNYKLNGAPVLALKYFTKDYISTTLANNETFPSRQKDSLSEREINLEINFPYKKHDHVEIDSNYASTNDDIDKDDFDSDTCSSFNEIKDISCSRHKKTWMHDYNKFAEVSVRQEDEEETDDEDERTYINYGSADPSIPTSSVPCGGCGAHLHCKDPAIPGYLPKEIFTGLKPQQLRAVVCQRCHFLQQYNTALSVTVDPDTYPKLLSKIKGEKAMVILVVDMTDFPCSIWPGILDIVGRRRPLVVVGNKVDLLQDWSRGMLQRAKQALLAQLPPKANILHTALVSAKTGFGIEDLITALYNIWQYRGDVYLVGCTNVGKSMLFNALLQSDYCRTRAVDLIQRATTAPWPGTTLNLLKFPITRPEGHRLAMRSLRLKQQNMNDLQQIQQGGHHEVTPQMISQINRTFSHGNIESNSDEYSDDLFAMPKLEVLRKIREPGSGLDPSDPMLAKSKWLYDTPGVITSDQIINLLTTEELMLTLPRRPLIPRTFTVWAGQSLMVGGLGRLDYLSGNTNIKMTVLAADTLPVTICFTQDAAEVYSHYLGSAALAVPCGSPERLRLWPGLKSKEEFALKGIGWNESCGDVVLSSAGWVALTAAKDNLVRLQPWTLEGRGAYVRIPPVLPRAVCVKGQRMFKSPAYALFNDSIKLRNN